MLHPERQADTTNADELDRTSHILPALYRGRKERYDLLFVRYPYGGVSNHGDWQGPENMTSPTSTLSFTMY